MIGLALFVLVLLIGLSYFLYKNQQDHHEVRELLRETQVEDEEHEKRSIF